MLVFRYITDQDDFINFSGIDTNIAQCLLAWIYLLKNERSV